MTATIGAATWLAAMDRHGPRAGWISLDRATHVRDVWHWDTDGGRLTVAVDRYRAGSTSVEVFRGGVRVFEARAEEEWDDRRVADALRLAGLLPRMVPAVDRDDESLWFASDDEMFWRRKDAAGRSGDRQLYVEAATAC